MAIFFFKKFIQKYLVHREIFSASPLTRRQVSAYAVTLVPTIRLMYKAFLRQHFRY